MHACMIPIKRLLLSVIIGITFIAPLHSSRPILDGYCLCPFLLFTSFIVFVSHVYCITKNALQVAITTSTLKFWEAPSKLLIAMADIL